MGALYDYVVNNEVNKNVLRSVEESNAPAPTPTGNLDTVEVIFVRGEGVTSDLKICVAAAFGVTYATTPYTMLYGSNNSVTIPVVRYKEEAIVYVYDENDDVCLLSGENLTQGRYIKGAGTITINGPTQEE